MSISIKKKNSGSLECPSCEFGTLVKTTPKVASPNASYRKCNECGSKFFVKEENGKYEGYVV